MNMTGHPKLFGGSLEEYLEVTCEEIPLIMRSCIRVINLYGKIGVGWVYVSSELIRNMLRQVYTIKVFSAFLDLKWKYQISEKVLNVVKIVWLIQPTHQI